MSLHDAANQVQSAGRGEDKVLVHMTPKEVGGLQSLAMAHGGSLTINPQTGLPEAGFLSSLLPMAIGFGLAPFTGGMSAALITGAGYTAATGSLKKGIMAGLGAYGGAGLGAGLSSLGTTAVAPATAGLSPTVAANTSALAGTSPLANVGNTAISSVDDIFAGVAKTPVTGVSNSTPLALNSASTLPSTPPIVPTTTAATVYPPGHPLYTPVQSQMNLASQTFTPSSATPGIKPTSLAERQAVLGEQIGGFDVTGGVSKAYRPPSLLDRAAGARQSYPDLSTLKYGGGYSTAPGGRYFIENPLQGSSVPKVSGYTPSTATTSQQFAKGMQHTPSTSTAVDVSGQSISRPFSDYMSQVGQGAKTALSSTDGLKALYSASEAAAPYSGVAGLGSTAMNYMEEKRKEQEEEMRRRANKSPGMIRPYEFDYNATNIAGEPYLGSAERTYFQPSYTALTPYEAPGPEYKKAAGGLTALAVGGQVEQMAAMNAVGANTGYPMANLQTPMYANPAMQRPEATNVIAPSADAGVGSYTGEARFAGGGETQYGVASNPNHVNPETQNRSQLAGGRSGVATPDYGTGSGYKYDYDPATMQFTQIGGPKSAALTGGTAQPVMQPTNPAQPLIPNIDIPAYQTPEQQLGLGGFYDMMNQQLGGYGGYAAGGNVGGISHLGDYSDGGRLLKGPGDGVSDSIPASIGNRQPARLADGEFVVPARIVSEIGNGSTEAGARKLYAMMDRVQRARRKTVGKGQVAKNTKAEKLLPA